MSEQDYTTSADMHTHLASIGDQSRLSSLTQRPGFRELTLIFCALGSCAISRTTKTSNNLDILYKSDGMAWLLSLSAARIVGASCCGNLAHSCTSDATMTRCGLKSLPRRSAVADSFGSASSASNPVDRTLICSVSSQPSDVVLNDDGATCDQ